MKKLSLLVVVLLLFVIGVGCTSNESETVATVQTGAKSEETVEMAIEHNGDLDVPQEQSQFLFEYNGITFGVYDEAGPVLEQLGEPMTYFEAESCAFQGLDKIYTYPGFEMVTSQLDGVDHIYSIYFLDDTVSTSEGVYLFDSFDTMVDTYGDEYTNSLSLYKYQDEMTNLVFLVEDNEVVSVEYLAIVE